MGQKYFYVATGVDADGVTTVEQVYTPEYLAKIFMFQEHLEATLPGHGGRLVGAEEFVFVEEPRDVIEAREVEAGHRGLEAEMLSAGGGELGYWLPDQPFDPDNPINPVASGVRLDVDEGVVEPVDPLLGRLVDLDTILG